MNKPKLSDWNNVQKYLRYTNKSTGMTYIKFEGNFWYKVEYIQMQYCLIARKCIKFKKSGALGGFQLMTQDSSLLNDNYKV